MALALLVVGWPVLAGPWPRDLDFPFMRFTLGSPLLDLGLTAAVVTAVYLVYTWLVFQVTRRLPTSPVVAFFARHTVLIFIAHMPIFFAVYPLIDTAVAASREQLGLAGHATADYGLRVLLRLGACFVGPALLSVVLQRLVRLPALRAQVGWWVKGKKHPGGHGRHR